jgi:hypothetical protein
MARLHELTGQYLGEDTEGDAIRRLANRLVGILHGCLKTRTLYDEVTVWSHREQIKTAA